MTSLDAPVTVRSRLERALDETGARLQLIRRPGRRIREGDAAPRRWFVVDVAAQHVYAQATVEEDWSPVIESLGERAPTAASGRRFVLVCTNGRKDMCCAVRGRPVATALAERWPADVWECTHTGGDRFAGNVVVLPDGVIYGALDPESALAVLDAHGQGRLADPRVVRHLRGYAGFSPVEQAARAALATQISQVGLPPWDRTRVAATASRDGADWRCSLTLDGRLFATVNGHDENRPAQYLTCSATATSRAKVPVIDQVQRPA